MLCVFIKIPWQSDFNEYPKHIVFLLQIDENDSLIIKTYPPYLFSADHHNLG